MPSQPPLPRVPGRVIALIGPDAAGKTTLAAGLASARRASGDEVQVIHLGSPPPTTATAVPRRVLRLWRRIFRSGKTQRGAPVFQAAISLLDAWERRAMALACHRAARRGVLVFTDRYPGRVMGSASGPRIPGGEGPVLRWLATLETRIYASIPDPDLVLRVTVSVEETLRRNAARPEPKAEGVIRASHEAANRLRFPGVPEITVDNHRPHEEVLRDLPQRVAQILDSPTPSAARE